MLWSMHASDERRKHVELMEINFFPMVCLLYKRLYSDELLILSRYGRSIDLRALTVPFNWHDSQRGKYEYAKHSSTAYRVIKTSESNMRFVCARASSTECTQSVILSHCVGSSLLFCMLLCNSPCFFLRLPLIRFFYYIICNSMIGFLTFYRTQISHPICPFDSLSALYRYFIQLGKFSLLLFVRWCITIFNTNKTSLQLW